MLALDSSTFVEIMRARNRTVQQAFMALDTEQSPVVASVLVLHELLSGARLGDNPAGERAKVERVLRGIDVVALEPSDIEFTAKVRADLRRQGRPIGDVDALIAGQALARGWTLVTRNVKHFGRVEGLSLIDWAVGPEPLSAEAVAARVREGE
ncbi:MAG: PIN domain-containing protein [Brevundimonas sp.]|nr:PIN domain-containing protein [Brevundimonas sp.]